MPCQVPGIYYCHICPSRYVSPTQERNLMFGKRALQTHGAYGAGQAGGHLPMLVAVHRRVTTTATATASATTITPTSTSARLGRGSSGRICRRFIPLQPVGKRLPNHVITAVLLAEGRRRGRRGRAGRGRGQIKNRAQQHNILATTTNRLLSNRPNSCTSTSFVLRAIQ